MSATYNFCTNCSIPIVTIHQENFERVEISTDRRPKKSLRFVTIEGNHSKPAKIFIPHVCQPLNSALRRLHQTLIRTLHQSQSTACNVEDLENNLHQTLDEMARDRNTFVVAEHRDTLEKEVMIESYISEEYRLAAAIDRTGTEENTTINQGLLFASIHSETTTTSGTLHYIRIEEIDGREAKSVHTLPMDQVKIFEDDSQIPVERHHHTKEITLNPYTKKVMTEDDRLDYIEITIPEGSVVSNYDINLE